ncbi:MAG: siderophore-interacting protein [Pseudomonadota bacterium]
MTTAATQAPKPRRQPALLSVRRAERITPNMIRVTLTAPEMAALSPTIAGAHRKIMLPAPGQGREDSARQLAEGPRRPVQPQWRARAAGRRPRNLGR